jgi:hypothetical protein
LTKCDFISTFIAWDEQSPLPSGYA